VCYDGSLIVFQFCGAVWLWVLLTGSGDKFCGPLPALLQGVVYHWLAVSLPTFPALFTDSSAEISSLLLPLSQLYFQQSHLFCCVLDYNSLFIVQFFLGGVILSAQGAVLFYPRDGWGNST
jgi:hypothetical protein